MQEITIRHGLSKDGHWLTDKWAARTMWTIGIDAVLFDKQSEFQQIQVVKTAELGRMLILDGNLQAAERDEHGYHEMIVHPALCRRGAGTGNKRVLIIGGGDGGAAREVLRHRDVERVDLCDIDPMVMDAAREYLPSMWRTPDGRALDEDPRLLIHERDGVAFLEETTERWDLIIIDASDPYGPGTALYSDRFYDSIRSALTETGAVSVQAGSWFYLPEVLQTVRRGLALHFPVVRALQCFTALYPGGFWNLVIATQGDDPVDVDEGRSALPGVQFYDADAHRAAFAIGPRAREVFAAEPPSLDALAEHLERLMD